MWRSTTPDWPDVTSSTLPGRRASWPGVLRRLPACSQEPLADVSGRGGIVAVMDTGNQPRGSDQQDRKSTCLNSSHVRISYAVFCLKKKKKSNIPHTDVQTKKRKTTS